MSGRSALPGQHPDPCLYVVVNRGGMTHPHRGMSGTDDYDRVTVLFGQGLVASWVDLPRLPFAPATDDGKRTPKTAPVRSPVFGPAEDALPKRAPPPTRERERRGR
jgi:hypothetical protein